MPRKTSFCNAALLRSDIKRYWPLLFLYVAVWVVILPMQILSASRECDGVAEGIMTVLQLRQHNVIIQSIPASVVMSLLFGCFAAMAVWSYLMSGRTVGLMHALPVTRTQAFFSHVLSALGALTAGNVLIFLLTALCSAGFSYVDWAALGTWLLLTELMALFFFALGSLCAMVTGWLLAVPVLYGAMNVIALLLYAVISTMTQMFYFGYSSSDIPEFITWLTPVGRIWDAVANGGAQPIEVQFREPIGTQSYQRVQLPASAFSTCIIYAAVGIALLALVWWLYKKRPSETAGDAMSFRWLRPIARWSIGLCGGLGLGLFLRYTAFIDGGFACLLICQLVMGVICFFAAQMLLQKKFRIFNKRWWLETAAMVLVLAAVLYAAVFGLTDTLVSWFNSENSVQMAQYAHTGMRMYFVGYFFAGFNIMAAGYLSAVNRPAEASITSICRGMVAIVACSLVLSAVFGMPGVWAAFPASELLTALLTLFLLRRKENGKA